MTAPPVMPCALPPSKQVRYQRRQRAAGRCTQCGRSGAVGIACPACADKKRRRVQRHYRRHLAQPARSPTASARAGRQQVLYLADWYVRSLLSQNTSLPPRAWPQSLINLKRNLLTLKRLLCQTWELNA